jgi:predicted AAA+ superfamily ATPase
MQEHYSKARFYNLLDTSEALRLSKAPSLLAQEVAHLPAKSWVVIDEVQKVPALLDEVHRLIESKKIHFLLSGSSARKLKREGANLLAGRASVARMFPFVTKELTRDFKNAFDLERALNFGTLPLAVSAEEPRDFLKAYSQTYLEEEIKAEALTRNIGGFARFLEVAARQNGQITNTSSISRDAQVARQTVQTYFDVLIDTLIGSWLPAWKLKRATKQVAHPKFYFFDTGVVRALSERLPYPVTSEERGSLFETLVLNELRAYLSYTKLDYPIYFWSSHDGVEVDIFLETTAGFVAIEIKSSSRWEHRYSSGLRRISSEMKKKVRLYGVYTGDHALKDEGIEVLPFRAFAEALWSGALI